MPEHVQGPEEQDPEELEPEDTSERRSETVSLTRMVIQSFLAMGPKGRKRMRIAGVSVMALGAVPPAIAGAIPGGNLSIPYLLFQGVVFSAGLLLFWPDAFVLFVRMVPSALVKIIPTKILGKLDRRNSQQSDEEE